MASYRASNYFPFSKVHALYQGRVLTHLPMRRIAGRWPVEGVPQGREVANAPPGSLLFLSRRAVDHALVAVYAPNHP